MFEVGDVVHDLAGVPMTVSKVSKHVVHTQWFDDENQLHEGHFSPNLIWESKEDESSILEDWFWMILAAIGLIGTLAIVLLLTRP